MTYVRCKHVYSHKSKDMTYTGLRVGTSHKIFVIYDVIHGVAKIPLEITRGSL
jgi:hypothetical protein